MFDPKFIDDAVNKLSDNLPPAAANLKEELSKNFRSIIQGMFAKMDLVTREEFDAQTKVLARTREKLERIETQLDSLES